ncbi:MAG: hypothetical protein WCV99_13455 [Sterolibacterium sp.]
MTTTDADLLQHAADLLVIDATSLRECHNVDPQHPDWKDEPDARAAHDDALCTAIRLRMLAKRMKESGPPSTELIHLRAVRDLTYRMWPHHRLILENAGKAAVSPAPTMGDKHG